MIKFMFKSNFFKKKKQYNENYIMVKSYNQGPDGLQLM